MTASTAGPAGPRKREPPRLWPDRAPPPEPPPSPDRVVANLPMGRRVRALRERPMLIASVAAHGALLVLLLLLLHRKQPADDGRSEQSVAMVFEQAPKAPTPAAPRAGLEQAPKPGTVPPPETPPVPNTLPIPPAPPPPPPPSAETAPPPPTPAPAPPRQQAEVNPLPPPAPAPPLPDLTAPELPLPVPPLEPDTIPPPRPHAAPARPAAPQREAALLPPLMRPSHPGPRAPASRNGFPAPMNYSFGPMAPNTRAPRSIARSMLEPPAPNDDADPGAGARTSASMMSDFARVREGNPGPDFYASLKRWWVNHRFYPPQAVERGEDGDVQLALIVDSQGRVTDVQIEGRSGSMYLDMAGESVWRDAQLLPPPDSMGRSHITVDITLHYQLVR